MNPFWSQTGKDTRPLFHHTHFHQEQSLGEIWAFPQELWSKCGSGGDLLRSTVAGAVMSLVPKHLLIFEMDPKAVDRRGLMPSSGTCAAASVHWSTQIILFNVLPLEEQKLAEVLKVPLRPLTSGQRPFAQAEPPSDFVLVRSSVN